jgi:hypothetical protein
MDLGDALDLLKNLMVWKTQRMMRLPDPQAEDQRVG